MCTCVCLCVHCMCVCVCLCDSMCVYVWECLRVCTCECVLSVHVHKFNMIKRAWVYTVLFIYLIARKTRHCISTNDILIDTVKGLITALFLLSVFYHCSTLGCGPSTHICFLFLCMYVFVSVCTNSLMIPS